MLQTLSMTYLLSVVSALLSVQPALAALKAPDFSVEIASPVITASAPAGHHINKDAPIALKIPGSANLAPAQVSAQGASFNISSATSDQGTISLYLCDDAGTFCEKHELPVNWTKTSAAATPAQAAAKLTAVNRGPSARDKHGFIDNQPDAAFAEASSRGAPVIVDFYGIWCPPCNELNDLVFATPEFKKASKKFVLLKMDVDAPATDPLAVKYKITGYPTVLILTPEGQELGRILGFRAKAEVLATLRDSWNRRSRSLAELQKKADAGDHEARDEFGLLSYNGGKYDLAAKYLEGSARYGEKLFDAKAALLEEAETAGDKSAREKRVALLNDAIRAFPVTPDSVQRRETLAQLLEEDKKADSAARVQEIHRDLIATAKNLIAAPEKLKGYDCELEDLWVSVAEAGSAESAETKEAWAHAIDFYRKKIAEGSVRGSNLELAYCLRQAGRMPEAEKVYLQLEKDYPGEFTFYFGHARALLAEKRSQEALPVALLALQNSYGINRLGSAELLAKIYRDLKRNKDGAQVIDEALKSVKESGAGEQSRTRRRMKQLAELQKQLQA